jgi:hypothetical protein
LVFGFPTLLCLSTLVLVSAREVSHVRGIRKVVHG